MKEELLNQLNQWISIHRNSYDQNINEKVYWNMLDLLNLVKNENREEIISIYVNMFNRFKFYY